MKKPTNLRLPQLSEILLIDSKLDIAEPVPETEVSLTAHLAGLVAVGGKFDKDSLLNAYENGIFPWPHGDQVDLWFCPVWRGVLDFDDLHVPKSLLKKIKKSSLRITLNEAFEEVVSMCATVPRRGQSGTWIVDELVRGYNALRKSGVAHSVEAWRGNKLIAGVYGIYAGGNFSAESMFGVESDSSKIVLLRLIEWLKFSGLKFLDIQMVTPVTKSLGGKYVSRRDFLQRLLKLKKKPRVLDLGHFRAKA